MTWIITPYAVALFICAVFAVVIAAMLWQRKTGRATCYLGWVMLAAAVWSLGQGLEASAIGTETKIFFSKISYIGVTASPPMLFFFTMAYLNLDRRLTPLRCFLVWVVPGATLLLAMTNQLHHLVWTTFMPSPVVQNLLIYGHGSWFWFAMTYFYLLLGFCTIALLWNAIRLRGVLGNRFFVFFIAILFPVIANIGYLFDWNLFGGLDFTPVGFIFMGSTLCWGIYRLRLFNVIPVMRDVLLDQMIDGILLLDAEMNIADINPAACRILQVSERVSGKPFEELIRLHPVFQNVDLQKPGERFEIALSRTPPCYLDVVISVFPDAHPSQKGRLIVLHDITRRVQAETAEREQHNIAAALRDSMAALNRTLDLEGVMEQILSNLDKVIPYDMANVLLIDQKGHIETVRTHGSLYSEDEGVFLEQLYLELLEPAQRQTPYRIEDTSFETSPFFKKFPSLKSCLGVPVRAHGRLEGFINLYSKTVGLYSQEQADHLMAFADQAGLAIQNSRLYMASQKYLRQTQALQKSSLAINSNLNFYDLMESIIEELALVISFDMAGVLLRKGDEFEIVNVAGFANSAEIIGRSFPLGGGSPSWEVATKRDVIIIRDVRINHASAFEGIYHEIRSWMGVPLFAQDEVIGILALDSKEVDHFTAEDKRIAQVFGSQVALAMENARLYTEMGRRLKEQSILNEVSQSISSSLDMNNLMERVYQQIKRFINVDYFYIANYECEEQTWEIIFSRKKGQPNVQAFQYSISDGFSGYVIESREALFLLDDQRVQEFSRRTGRVSKFSHPRSLMVVPLIKADRVIGVISAQDDEKELAFSSDDFSLFLTIAPQVAVALENARLFKQMEILATTDNLTGLYNRRHFFFLGNAEVQRTNRYHSSLSLAMVDIDHFKKVNDQYGHAAGDFVLQRLAQIFKQEYRKIDVIGRYGGEEFAILMPETSLSQAVLAADRLRQVIAEHVFDSSAQTIFITVSIGVSTIRDSDQSLENLLDCADKALYAAKQGGRNRVCAYEGN